MEQRQTDTPRSRWGSCSSSSSRCSSASPAGSSSSTILMAETQESRNRRRLGSEDGEMQKNCLPHFSQWKKFSLPPTLSKLSVSLVTLKLEILFQRFQVNHVSYHFQMILYPKLKTAKLKSSRIAVHTAIQIPTWKVETHLQMPQSLQW